MKHILIILMALLFTSRLNAQNDESLLPRMIGDTLLTSSGYKIVKGQEIKLGTGSMPDGDFKFIRINSASLFAYHSTSGYQKQANSANSLPRSQSGLKHKIKVLEKRGNKKHGYVYYAKIGMGLVNYEIDVENAIHAGELNVPEEFRPKPKQQAIAVQIKQEFSIPDELAKLKKLLDEGILTQEEYDAQKKKLLGQQQ